MANAEMKQLMESRAGMYNMLARSVIEEVDEKFLKELKRMHFPQNTGDEEVDAAYLDLYRFLRKTKESVIDDLAVDYARTFLGVGTMESRAAYPFESVYTSDKGLLMQAARDEVLAIYKAEGLDGQLRNPHNEGEDHLALELMFMREMALRTAAAFDGDDEDRCSNLLLTQRNFLHDHILNWAIRWAEDVPKYAKEGFYPAFARLTAAYLQEDIEMLVEMVGNDEDDEAANTVQSDDVEEAEGPTDARTTASEREESAKEAE